MTRKTLPTLLLLLAACASNPGPEEDPRIVTPLTVEPPPIYALLGYPELALQSAQIAALDSIAEAVRVRNGPLVDSLQAAGDRNGRGYFRVDGQTQPLLDRIQASNREAVEAVREVLTDEQESTTCRLFREARDRRRTERGGRRPPALPDSVAARMGGGTVWSWCGATAGIP